MSSVLFCSVVMKIHCFVLYYLATSILKAKAYGIDLSACLPSHTFPMEGQNTKPLITHLQTFQNFTVPKTSLYRVTFGM